MKVARATYQINPHNARIELERDNTTDPDALTLRVFGDAESGTRETVTVKLNEYNVRHLHNGLDQLAPRPLQLPDDIYTGLMDAIGNAIEYSDVLDDEAMDADDMEGQDKYHQQAADFRELRDRLKVLTGKAKNFDDHFTVVKNDNGDPVDAYPVEDENRHLWTVLDCDGELCIVPGFAYVNRLQHIMTVEPWTDADKSEEWIY